MTIEEFRAEYEAEMLRYDSPYLPKPHGIARGIFHNYRPWEYWKMMQYGEFKEGDLVLDCGAMHTYFCLYLAKRVDWVFSTDSFYWAHRDYMKKEKLLSPGDWSNFIEEARSNVTAEEADLCNLKYNNESFDKIVCISVIEHVFLDMIAFGEMLRILKPGGRLLITTEYDPKTPKTYSEDDGSYYRIYDPGGLRYLVQHPDLDVLVIEEENSNARGNAFICGVKR